MSETAKKHKKEAPEKVKVAVITISDSKFEYLRTKDKTLEEQKDVSGRIIIDELEKRGHEVVTYTVIPDDEKQILRAVDEAISLHHPDIIITTGGTGISRKDVTIEALEGIFKKRIEGFGELFRKKSFEEIGPSAMLTRATAGIYNGSIIFSLPGSPHAVKTGSNLIMNELGHIAKHAKE